MKNLIISAIIVLSMATNGWSASITSVFTALVFNTTRTLPPVSAELPIPGTVITSTDPGLSPTETDVGNQLAHNFDGVLSAGFGISGPSDSVGSEDVESSGGAGPNDIVGSEDVESSGGAGPNDIPYGIAKPGSSLDIVPVPESSTFLLLGAGLIGVAFMMRRAKK